MNYYSLNKYLKNTFGEKVYKISLNGNMTCPNRDGTLGTKGCIFCSRGGSGEFSADRNHSITEQIREAKERIGRKTDCKKFIAYFRLRIPMHRQNILKKFSQRQYPNPM